MIWLLTLICFSLCAALAPRQATGRCPVCGREPRPRFKYCPVCWQFCGGAHKGIPAAIRAAALRKALDPTTGGFRCFYTGILLVLDDPGSPMYLSFDHIDPRKGRIVVCARLINEMKEDLTGDEFRTAVLAINDYLENGVPLKPDLIGFVCWPKRYDMAPQVPLGHTPPSPKGCKICQMKRRPYSTYCNRCRKFIQNKPERAARSEAMAVAWDIVRQGFVCRYSGVLLDYLNTQSPWYMTFDHRFPGKKGNLVVCAAWINYMKTSLTDEQFRAVLEALAHHFRDGTPFDKGVLEWT
jgi:hypothetical protein